MSQELPVAVHEIFTAVRRLQLEVGVDDLVELRAALRAGYGLESDRAFTELCVGLWATSDAEAASVRAVCARHAPVWQSVAAGPDPVSGTGTGRLDGSDPGSPSDGLGTPEPGTEVAPTPAPPASGGELPALPALESSGRRVVFVPQYPVTRRAIAQAFRRLRRSVPSGARVQLDVKATIDARHRSGVVTPPVMVPRHRNTARLLLLIDQQGSMVPFHLYTEHVRVAITEDGGLGSVDVAWFHDCPVGEPESRLARRLSRLSPQLDPVLPEVRGSLDGLVFGDAGMTEPLLLERVVEASSDAGVVVLTDAGAARGAVDVMRNLATVAFARRLRELGRRAVWLNPMPQECWAGTSAALLARHVPMLPLDAAGLHRAVDVLRGRPIAVQRAA